MTPVGLDCQRAVVRDSAVVLSGSEGSLGPWRETLRCAQGDNRVRVLWSRVVSGRGKFESGWSPVAGVVRVVGVVGVVGIAVLFSENGVPVNG